MVWAAEFRAELFLHRRIFQMGLKTILVTISPLVVVTTLILKTVSFSEFYMGMHVYKQPVLI